MSRQAPDADADADADIDTHVLALNSGSSSLKFGLYRLCGADTLCLLSGEAEGLGEAGASFHATDAQGAVLVQETSAMADAGAAVVRIGKLLSDRNAPHPAAIGHRVVHGGPHLRQHCTIDASVLATLEAAAAFAPLHTPAALAVIRYALGHFPGLPQVACLDTCFHAAMPLVASTLPLPRHLRAAGIQRYGFHGLSCESIVRHYASKVPWRLIIAHLGSGASITAVRNGLSIDTSMGLTPTGGLIMGTRSGDLDPGVLVHLMRTQRLDAAAMEDLVDHHSGLLGLSGISGDMRALHDAAAAQGDARLAIAMFCYRVAKELGAMAIALGGVDEIVFTGGIGAHDVQVRADVCARLSSLGVALDERRNLRGIGLVSHDASRCVVRVLPSQEDEQIARHTWALCGLAA
ncbi:MAG: acetate/propionate family kinase [Aquabacterium sp.]|nr:acetate/propionate family kinase [Aquabacterium sp.]